MSDTTATNWRASMTREDLETESASLRTALSAWQERAMVLEDQVVEQDREKIALLAELATIDAALWPAGKPENYEPSRAVRIRALMQLSARDRTALEAIEERFVDGSDTLEDWRFMGETAREALGKESERKPL